MLLEDKVAVIHGGGGSIGGAAARVFAREGARLFLAGKSLPRLEAAASVARAEGARLIKAENTQETLEDVFLRAVQESGDGLVYRKPPAAPAGDAKPAPRAEEKS